MILKNVLMCLGREWRWNIWNILLYADDVVIFAESPELLQMEIDVLYNYCEQWKLKLNTQKSKILVFRKGNRLPTEEWTFG